jgi:predicted  nucleic acid-binding Zn-ribbon protein
MKEILKNRMDFYQKELDYYKEDDREKFVEEQFQKLISKKRVNHKKFSLYMNASLWIHLIHEMHLLYDILYQLVGSIEVDLGKLKSIEKEAKEKLPSLEKSMENLTKSYERFKPVFDEIDRQIENYEKKEKELGKSGIYE